MNEVAMKDTPANTSSAASTAPAGSIVVGVDGSEPSKAALAWAARQAALTGSVLEAITVWRLPANFGWALPLPEDLDLEGDARTLLEDTVKEVLGSDPGIEVKTIVAQGQPAHVLTEASMTASLVVVASRGHGEFTGMILGSVSEFLAAHAHCPVVVVRDGHKGERAA
jgi:nucleotide-binding universal stress UspA family protein